MSRTKLEVADIFRGQGPAWRQANAGHVSLEQLKVMSAIENCRTAELGGHVVRCENETCGHTEIGYNSCRNRHCPKCQGAAAREWLAEREAELLPVPHFHVVFSLPAQIADIAYQNKAAIYERLRPQRNPHSCGTTAVPNPRFPALALFGRRPSECVERPSSRQPKTYTPTDLGEPTREVSA